MRHWYRALLLVTALATLLCLPDTRIAWAGERPESQQEYWSQVDQRDWSAAVEAAQRLVTAARTKARQHPLDLAAALTLLANAHFGTADYASAEVAYAEALDIVQAHASSTSIRLIEPLRGLGYALAGAGRHAEAIPHLQRALLITHRSLGLFDISQQGILQQLAASLTRTGQAPEAERQMLYLLQVSERVYGRNDPRHAPALVLVGNWYGELGAFQAGREYFRNAISIMEKALGDSDPALVDPLRALAASYTRELVFSTLRLKTDRPQYPSSADGSGNEYKIINPRYLDGDGESALERALAILDAQAEPPVALLTELLLQYGDWYQIKQRPDKALPFYRRAASLTATANVQADADSDSDTNDEPAKRTPLSFPARVYYPVPLQATRNLSLPREQVEETFVQVEFTVTREGTVVDAEIVEQNGSARQASEMLEATRASRFRPRFVDGEPVETTGVTDREVFRTRKTGNAQEND